MLHSPKFGSVNNQCVDLWNPELNMRRVSLFSCPQKTVCSAFEEKSFISPALNSKMISTEILHVQHTATYSPISLKILNSGLGLGLGIGL